MDMGLAELFEFKMSEKEREEFWRQRALEDFSRRLESLEEQVDYCIPSAVYGIRSLTHNLYISYQNGELTLKDYHKFDRKLEELTRKFVERCVRRR